MPCVHAIALRASGLVKCYGSLRAVDGIDLEVHRGECFGLLGPNGAGKTTTVELFEGLLDPDFGFVEVLGLRWNGDADGLRGRIGIQLQETQLADKLTVLETISLFRSFYANGRSPEEVLGLVHLEEKSHSWVRKLSGGQKQRLSLACALVSDPEVVFLDEPTTGLDPQSRRQVWEIVEDLRARDRTVLLTTHYMEEAQRLCERVAIVDHGKVIALDSPERLVASLGAEHVLEIDTESRPDLEALRSLPAVQDVRENAGAFRLTVTEVHAAVPAVLAELARQRIEMTRLVTHHATLEDVFVSLTGRHLRDA